MMGYPQTDIFSIFVFNNIMGLTFIFQFPFFRRCTRPGAINPLESATYNLRQIARISNKSLCFHVHNGIHRQLPGGEDARQCARPVDENARSAFECGAAATAFRPWFIRKRTIARPRKAVAAATAFQVAFGKIFGAEATEITGNGRR